VALAVGEVLDDGGCGALARDLLDDVSLLRGGEPLAAESPDREGPEAGCWMRCDFKKIVCVVVVLQLRKISIGYGGGIAGRQHWQCGRRG
jgi:hypothetical protein